MGVETGRYPGIYSTIRIKMPSAKVAAKKKADVKKNVALGVKKTTKTKTKKVSKKAEKKTVKKVAKKAAVAKKVVAAKPKAAKGGKKKQITMDLKTEHTHTNKVQNTIIVRI